jgi:hypothetical protein
MPAFSAANVRAFATLVVCSVEERPRPCLSQPEQQRLHTTITV